MNENKLWKHFSVYIRVRDAAPFTGLCKCITCGRVSDWKNMDCGHGIPRQHKGTKYSELNNHAQCKVCNGFEGGRQDAYMKAVDKKYGEGTWDKLLVLSRKTTKYSQFEIDTMAEFYKKEGEKLRKEKNI